MLGRVGLIVGFASLVGCGDDGKGAAFIQQQPEILGG